MRGSTGKNAIRSSLVLTLLVAGLLAAACDGQLRRKGEASTPPDRNVSEEEDWEAYGSDDAVAGYAGEAERTEAMEQQAAAMQQTYDDAIANATTDEERMRAYQEFEDGRQELNEMAEDEYAPPPAP